MSNTAKRSMAIPIESERQRSKSLSNIVVPPEDVGLLPDGARAKPKQGASAESVVESVLRREDSPWTVQEALRTRSYWLVVFAFTLISLPASSIFVHMVPYVMGKGYSATEGAFTLSAYGFGGLFGRVAWGLIITRLGIRWPLAGYGFIYGLTIITFTLPSSLFAIYAATFVLGLGIGGWSLLQAQTFPDYFGRRIVGSLVGISGLFFMVARAVAPLFAALVYDLSKNYIFAFSVFAGACVIASLALLLAPPPRHPSEKPIAVSSE